MGESAFLRRSFSSPSESSRERKEGDPCRALGESISFGRFMTEPLAWEKWSAFTHNRYLEEVERYSKPGSVAEKKAYFEAHYKKKAAERAAALLEAANVKTTDVVQESVSIEEKNCNDSSMNSELEKRESLNEHREIDVQITNYCTNETQSNSSVDRDEKECSMTELGEVIIQESIDMGSCDSIESLNQSEKNKENMSIEDVVCQNITASTSKQRPVNSSPGISSKQVTPIQTRSGNNLASRCKNFMQDLVDKKSAKSLHMSFHFSSHTGESSKPISPFRQKIISSKDLTASPKVFANNSTSQTKIKASVNGVVKKPSVNLKSENRSSKPILNKSVAEGTTLDRKQNCPSPDNSKSSGGKGSKSRSSIISSPFKFKSDERAAKRKEFYEKLEEKRYAEEAEKKRQQTRFQGKALQDVMKVRQSTVKGKPNEDLCSASQLSNCHIKKMNQIPLRQQPRSPTLVRKATPPIKIQDTTFVSLDNNESSKCLENNRSTIRSLAARFQRNNAHENASPNIQSSTVKR